MASKNASSASPDRARTASARAGEVRGPVATMTLSHSSGGRSGDLAAVDLDQRVGGQLRGDGPREPVAVHRQGAAGGHFVGVAGRA